VRFRVKTADRPGGPTGADESANLLRANRGGWKSVPRRLSRFAEIPSREPDLDNVAIMSKYRTFSGTAADGSRASFMVFRDSDAGVTPDRKQTAKFSQEPCLPW
jgi:hypothetical protein